VRWRASPRRSKSRGTAGERLVQFQSGPFMRDLVVGSIYERFSGCDRIGFSAIRSAVNAK